MGLELDGRGFVWWSGGGDAGPARWFACHRFMRFSFLYINSLTRALGLLAAQRPRVFLRVCFSVRVLSIHDDDDDDDYRAFCPMMSCRWLIGCCARCAVRCGVWLAETMAVKMCENIFCCLYTICTKREKDRDRWSECEHPFNCASMMCCQIHDPIVCNICCVHYLSANKTGRLLVGCYE